MRVRMFGPVAGLILLAVLVLPSTADILAWRPLRIEGVDVRWTKPVDEGGRQTLKWRVLSAAERYPDAINCKEMTSPEPLIAASQLTSSSFREELRAAFDMWQVAAGLRFVEALEGERADINIGVQAEPEGRAFADVAFDRESGNSTRAISRSLICLNPVVRWKVGFDGNLDVYDLRYTFAHEIGHAIGLDHPRQRGSLMWFRYDEKLKGLQSGDIEGATALYGAAPSPSMTQAGTHMFAARRPD